MAQKSKLRRPRKTNQSEKSGMTLDRRPKGGPFIRGTDGQGINAKAPPSAGATGPTQEVFVEVELARGATAGAQAVASTLSGMAGGAAPPSLPFAPVLNNFTLLEAQPVFSEVSARTDVERTAALRAAALSGTTVAGAVHPAPEQIAALEALPQISDFVRLRFAAGTSAADVTEALRRLPEVARAVEISGALPPMLMVAPPQPHDPLVGTGTLGLNPATKLETQWYLHRTRAPQAWRHARGDGVVVADIDWGYRTTHVELQPIELVYNAVDGGQDVTQGSYAAHGTAVLALIGARADGKGMVGYAPACDLWAIQGDSAPGTPMFAEPWAEAIDYVRRTDAGGRRKVINLEVQTGSYGNYEQIPSVHRAIRAAIAEGCVVCIAAGNGDQPADRTDGGEPFDPTGSILVGATEYHPDRDKRAYFSNYSPRIVVAAPGDTAHDLTCGQASDTAYRNGFGGTSGACPKVAGTAALMLAVNRRLTNAEIREILAGTGTPLTEDPGKPIGSLLNAEAAVAEAVRRLSETGATQPALNPDGTPAPEPAPAIQVHGLRRRQRQLVLPDDPTSPLVWVQPESSEAPTDNSAPPQGDRTLRQFRATIAGTLTLQDRILIVDQAIRMLDNFYVHRPLKESIHAVRPIQKLRVLQRRLLQQAQQSPDLPAGQRDELAFHNKLTEIFNSVRDLHTVYQLPRPFSDYIAYLPFEVAAFYEGGRRRYLVTQLVPGYVPGDPDFGPGAELTYWNGMAIERAVHSNAEQTAGGNEAARHARGVSSLTLRPMNTTLPPDADFVDLEFIPVGGNPDEASDLKQMRQQWFVRYVPTTAPPTRTEAEPAATSLADAAASSVDIRQESLERATEVLRAMPPTEALSDIAWASALALDSANDAAREARQLIFDPESLRNLQRGGQTEGLEAMAAPPSRAGAANKIPIAVNSTWGMAFSASRLNVGGTDVGHIRIKTFNVPDPDGFVAEFVRLLRAIPQDGLILDVRGNGGGHIWAAERLLQTMSPTRIEPERMQFLATTGTAELCHNNPAGSPIDLRLWQNSLEEAVETGAVYSHAFPITDPASCDTIGQVYYGPVVLIVDAKCYSATDIFAAGFQDHQIGTVLGVGSSTGAGGANVWEHWLLNRALPPGWGLKPLPNSASMRVAIRQCLRVGSRGGVLLEDFGVVPDDFHELTRNDVMNGDTDLLSHAVDLIKLDKTRAIQCKAGKATQDGDRQLRAIALQTTNLDRLDIFVDDRPSASRDLEPNSKGIAKLDVSIEVGAKLELIGFADTDPLQPVARLRTIVP